TAQRADPVAEIVALVPPTWKVRLGGGANGPTICIETEAMDTRDALNSGGNENTERRAPVMICFELLPKYSPDMLKRIDDFNKPTVARLETLRDSRSAEGRSLKNRLIPSPMFQDANFGYRLVTPSRVAVRAEDISRIERVLVKICAKWKSVGKDKRVV